MLRFIFPLFLIAISVTVFLMFTNPKYKELQVARVEMQNLDRALQNAKALQAERDNLADVYNGFSNRDIARVEKMVPSSVESIHLIQEIQDLGKRSGIIVKNVDFDPDKVSAGEAGAQDQSQTEAITRTQRITAELNLPYDVYDLKFAVQGSYSDFVSFLESLEKSLRIVDIKEVTFASNTSKKDQYSDVYDYTFTISTYRLRN